MYSPELPRMAFCVFYLIITHNEAIFVSEQYLINTVFLNLRFVGQRRRVLFPVLPVELDNFHILRISVKTVEVDGYTVGI